MSSRHVSQERGTPSIPAPEEIRHLVIRRVVGGYHRGEVDQLLREIADSFESVWHERTRLFEDVQRLQAQLTQQEAAMAKVRDEVERSKADHDKLIAELERAESNVRDLSATMEQLEPARSNHDEHEARSAAELTRLRDAVSELQTDRDRLLREARATHTAAATEREARKKLSEFLRDALTEVEREWSNAPTGTARPGELHDLRDTLGRELQHSSGSRRQPSPPSEAEDKNSPPPPREQPTRARGRAP